MASRRFLWRLCLTNLALIAIALFVTTSAALHVFRKSYLERTEHELGLFAQSIESQLVPALTGPADILNKTVSDLAVLSEKRITVIKADGTVLAESETNTRAFDNHLARPEIAIALHGIASSQQRFSNTLQREMLYFARPLRVNGEVFGVLRLAVEVRALSRELLATDRVVLLSALALFTLAGAAAYYGYRRILDPLDRIRNAAMEFAAGRLSFPVYADESREMHELAGAINSMASQLDQRLKHLESQKEEREAILSSMLEGVIAIDREDRILRFNRAAASFLGISQGHSEGRNVFEVVRSAALQRVIKDVISERGLLEREILLTGEKERCFEVSGRLLQNAAGEELGILLVLHDVTAVKQLETVRRDFVANVSHELRTPITSIKVAAETLLEGALARPEDAKNFAGMIARHADRLNRIIEDLLRLASLENLKRRKEIFFERVKVESFIQEALEDCQILATSRNVQLRREGDGAIEVQGNATLLTQALVNLISNAIEYSEPGGTVTVRCAACDEKAVMDVVDQGCGIEAAHLPRLFERFYRVDKARSRKSGGTGLGLAIVKHVAEAHGGTVTVNSTPGKGSTFSIIVPALPAGA